MKKRIALSQHRDHINPIMNSKTFDILAVTRYGGDDSESVPCGFVTDIEIRNHTSKRERKNNRYLDNLTTRALTKLGRATSPGVLKVER